MYFSFCDACAFDSAMYVFLFVTGLIFLGISGPLVLSFIVFLCSFVPVLGVFLSTLPMVVAALGDYGMSKVCKKAINKPSAPRMRKYITRNSWRLSFDCAISCRLHPTIVCITFAPHSAHRMMFDRSISFDCLRSRVSNLTGNGLEERFSVKRNHARFQCCVLLYQVFQVILMVLGVHAVEAYLLNPQVCTHNAPTYTIKHVFEHYTFLSFFVAPCLFVTDEFS